MKFALDLNVSPRPRSNLPRIIGADLSPSRSGLAIFEIGRSRASIETLSIRTETIARQRALPTILDAFYIRFLEVLLEIQPDFLAIEAPRKDIQMFTTTSGERVPNPGSTLEVNQVFGSARSAIRTYVLITGRDLPYETVPENTWRKKMYGFARKKDFDFKQKARDECRINLGITVSNDDEAEAALIALYAPNNMQTLKEMLNDMEIAA